jgi:hypothetical protein
MKCTSELMIRDAKEECVSIWGWGTEDSEAIVFRSNGLSTSALWGGSVIQLRWPKDEDVSLN